MNAGIPALFRTYETVDPAHTDCTIWQAARATSATPGFFSPMTIGNGQAYVDGGLGCNNPTKLVLSEAANLYRDRNIACVISIGSGHPSTIHASTNDAVLESFRQIAWDCEAVHEELSQRLDLKDRLYYRFSVAQGMHLAGEYEIGTSVEAEAHTSAYVTSHDVRERLSETAKVLLERKGRVPVRHLGQFAS